MRIRNSILWLAVLVALLALRHPDNASGQVGSQALVVEGGTLIDGNGGTPVRDIQVVIQASKIAKIGKKGDAIPAGAQVIRADGKFILPGLWDAQLNFYSYQGEAMLNSGVTSFIGIGDNGEAGVFMHFGWKNRFSPAF